MTPHQREHTRTFPIYPAGLTRHPSGDFVVDHEFYKELKKFHDDLRARGYFTPFAVAHNSDGPESDKRDPKQRLKGGLTHGRLIDLHWRGDRIDAEVYFADGVAELHDKGWLDGISPAHYTHGFTDPHTGRFYRTGLREISAVQVPHLKGMGRPSPWYQINTEGDVEWRPITELEELMSQNQTKQGEQTNPAQGVASQQTPDQSAKLDALIASVTSLSETVAKQGEQLTTLTTKKTEPVKTPAVSQNSEETPEQKRSRELEERLARTELELQRAKASAQIARRLPTASLEVVTSLTEAAIAMEPAHLEVLLKSQEAALAAKQTTNSTTINAEIGVMGNAPATGSMTRDQAIAKARTANIPVGAETVRWIATHYPHAR